MKLSSLLLPAAAVVGTAYLIVPESSSGYSLIGGSLSLSQRDVRMYNNWLDATANDNVTADSSFPGYVGAAMSCWKSGAEWASKLHGTGGGDPHQPSGMGSGGANFDFSWQGLATGTGGTNDNIISSLNASGGGTIAYTETPISDGWRIRGYESHKWDDGPGTTLSSGSLDMQGVMCHELGHALGLGHSGTSSATMYFAIIGSGVNNRSIATDDQNGVKAIYGTASASKPTITGVSKVGSTVTISGTNFSATGNEVWFTQAGAGGTGNPIKLTGVTSGGTSITVTQPGTAGPGDVLVRNNGTGNANLSNAWPLN
jgi:hypothetical protein